MDNAAYKRLAVVLSKLSPAERATVSTWVLDELANDNDLEPLVDCIERTLESRERRSGAVT